MGLAGWGLQEKNGTDKLYEKIVYVKHTERYFKELFEL